MARNFKRQTIYIGRPLWAPNPDLYGGTWVIAVFMLVMLLVQCSPASGQSWAPREERTVSWYLRNPSTLDFVTKNCRDNPGGLRHDPDCINASEARMEVARRQIENESNMRGAGYVQRPMDLTPPSDTRYWRDRPDERRQKLAFCARMTEAQQARDFCAQARAAETNTRTRRS